MLNYLPNIKFLLLLNLFLWLSSISFAQDFTENILKKIRNHQFTEVDSILELQPKTDLINELDFYNKLISSNGLEKDSLSLRLVQKTYEEPILIAISKLNKGLYRMLHDYHNLDKAFYELFTALDISKDLNNPPLVCEIIKAILLSYYDKSFTTVSHPALKGYLEEYKKYSYDLLEINIQRFLEIHLNLIYPEENNSIIDSNLEELILLSDNFSNSYFKAMSLISLGNYYENNLEDYEKSQTKYKEAFFNLRGYNQGIYAQKRMAAILNEVRTLQKKEEFDNAFKKIKEFQNLSSLYTGKQIAWLKKFEYLYLKESYAYLKIVDSAESLNIKYKKLKNKFNQSTENVHIEEKRIELEVEKKDKEIMNLTTILSIVLPILTIIALIAIALFYYLKKYKSKSKNLETEKSETLEKIEELKNIVVKNHIVLKDKTKVYIADLMYVKSEDHFIKLFLSNGKSHFVRGKISQIAEELPPNFIRSHRSYIINANFIKQINSNHIMLLDKTEIPLSRSHKNNFKDKP
ncbi:MAG: LytTR family DNA-binding domain-containing protein [Bacteroidota bacterium]